MTVGQDRRVDNDPVVARASTSTDRALALSNLASQPAYAGRRTSPRLKGFDYSGSYRYHVTINTSRGRSLLSARWADVCVRELERIAERAGFELDAHCVMPNHVHVLAAAAHEQAELGAFIRRFKQSVGFAYKQATGKPLWHRSYYDHVLRPSEDWRNHASYIINNPVIAGLAPSPLEWPYSGPKAVLSLPVASADVLAAISETLEEDRSEDLSVLAAVPPSQRCSHD